MIGAGTVVSDDGQQLVKDRLPIRLYPRLPTPLAAPGIITLDQWFSKCAPQTSWDTFQGACEIKTIFIIILSPYLPFFTVLMV